MAPIVLLLSRSPMTSADIRTMSLYSDARTYFQGPPCSIRLRRISTVRRGCRDSGCEETGGCGKECAHCPLLLRFLFLTAGLQLSEYYDQPSWIDRLMENAKIRSEVQIRALRRSMVSSLTCRGTGVDWRWIALWPMLDGEPGVGYTLVFLFLLFVFHDPLIPKAQFILYLGIDVRELIVLHILLSIWLFCRSSLQPTDNSVFRADLFSVSNPLPGPIIVHSFAFFHRTSLAWRTTYAIFKIWV